MANKKIYIIRSEGANDFILFLFTRIIFGFVCVAWALVHIFLAAYIAMCILYPTFKN